MFFARALKLAKSNSKENLSSNCSNRQLECTFDKHGDIFLSESINFLSEGPKVINKTLQLFCKKYSTRGALMDTTKAVLTTQLINIPQNLGDFLLNVRKRWGKNSKRILLKIILSPGEMQFWQPSQKLSNKTENFPLNVGTRKCKVFIGKFFCSTCSHVHLESSFYNPVEQIVTKCRWCSAQHLKTIEKKSILLWTRRRQFWQPHQKNFRQKPKTNRSRSEKKLRGAFLKK